jgi:hypothetical protein
MKKDKQQEQSEKLTADRWAPNKLLQVARFMIEFGMSTV